MNRQQKPDSIPYLIGACIGLTQRHTEHGKEHAKAAITDISKFTKMLEEVGNASSAFTVSEFLRGYETCFDDNQL